MKGSTSNYKEIEKLTAKYSRIAISTLLKTIYEYAVEIRPKHIVELGVSKEALANQVLTMVAKQFNSTMISCDIYDYSFVNNYENWFFVQAHDIDFAKVYREYCASIGINAEIDLLFIDTDEKYPHTKEEAEYWYPFLNQKCMVMWRCTNLKKELVYADGRKTNLGWDNGRGVIKAIEEHHGWRIDEEKEFNAKLIDRHNHRWEVTHLPWGAGLTILRRN